MRAWIKVGLALSILFFLYILFDNSYTEESIPEVIKNDQFSSITYFHWNHMPLSYKWVNKDFCRIYEIVGIESALNLLKKQTNNYVSFVETTNNTADIEFVCTEHTGVYCYNESFSYNKTKFYDYPNIINVTFLSKVTSPYVEYTFYICELDTSILGESMPFIDYSDYIINSSINLYSEEGAFDGCYNFSLRELHELLHSFGFEHNVQIEEADKLVEKDFLLAYSEKELLENELLIMKDILFPYGICKYQKEINLKYSNCLKYIYSNGTEPFTNCEGVKFLELSCPEGSFKVSGTDYCCPEPNMRIVNGYCSN